MEILLTSLDSVWLNLPSPEQASWWKGGISAKKHCVYQRIPIWNVWNVNFLTSVCVNQPFSIRRTSLKQSTNFQIYSNRVHSDVTLFLQVHWLFDRVAQQVDDGWGCALLNPIDLTQQCGNVGIWSLPESPISGTQQLQRWVNRRPRSELCR